MLAAVISSQADSIHDFTTYTVNALMLPVSQPALYKLKVSEYVSAEGCPSSPSAASGTENV